MERIYNLKKQPVDERDYQYAKLSATAPSPLPPYADLRAKMPEVFDQGQLGSCSANSTVADLMYTLGDISTLLSRLFQYYKTREKEGTVNEDSGCTNRDAVMSLVNNGVCEESFFPYDITKFTQKPSENAISNALLHKVKAVHAVNSLDEIKHSIAVAGSPVVLGMEVFQSFESQTLAKTGKMTMPKSTEQNLGGHSVLVVGYIDNVKGQVPKEFTKLIGKTRTKGYLIIRNSWGAEWGLKGYFLMPYEYLDNHTFDYWMIEK